MTSPLTPDALRTLLHRVQDEAMDRSNTNERIAFFREIEGALQELQERRAPPASFQERVAPWMQECFGAEISADKLERSDRFIEEALELLQSTGYPRERVAALVDYVYGRPIGEPSQEVGGVMVTLAALCLAHGLDMHDSGETELARIVQPEIITKIRAKQASKPHGSALPIAVAPSCGEVDARLLAAATVLANFDSDGSRTYEPNDDDLRCAAAILAAADATRPPGGCDVEPNKSAIFLSMPTDENALPTYYLAHYLRLAPFGSPIYQTHDPVREAAGAMPLDEADFLEHWLTFWHEPVGQECCGYADPQVGCCGNPVTVYNTPDDVRSAMNARLKVLHEAAQQPTNQPPPPILGATHD